MKKIILLFLIFSCTTLIGQSLTYTVESTIYVPNNNTNGDFYKFILSGNYSNLVYNNHAVVTTNYKSIVDVKNTDFTLTYAFGCTVANQGNPCAGQHVFYGTVAQLLTRAYTLGHGSAYVSRFIPNGLTIKRTSTNDINACENIELNAIPPPHTGIDFPDEAYHWLFKVQGDTQWRDIPLQTTNGKKINNDRISTFTMQDLLGDDYLNYFGSVTFALGYGQEIYSTNTLNVNYVPMAPVIDHIQYIPPTCAGDERELKIYFKRNLVAGEVLKDFSIINSTNSSMILYQATNSIATFIDGSYISVKGFNVEDAKYDITYQAFLNGNPKGCIKSAGDIKITNTEPLKFKIIKADNPTCNNDKVNITIEANGGIPPYFYDDLNGETEMVNGLPEIKRIQFDASDKNKTIVELNDLELKEYKIKVTDINKCIEN
ncbi:hypothetical protein [Flavobacterium sp.]|uniref:hypothetical protein n=1 Tax=Flavobacterium sp. TaxID=239 RepID=UPI0032662137